MTAERPQVLRDLSPQPAAAYGLVAAIQALSRARDLPAVASVVRSAARSLTAADGATFVLREDDCCHYMDEDAIGPLWKGQRFPMSACISGWAMQHGKAVAIGDIELDDRVPHAAYRATFVRSMAMVPIRPDDPLGAIGIYWARRHMATTKELDALQTLANATAVAMENVHLLAELEQRVQSRTSALVLANQELDAFTHTISHDLRTPLRAVAGFAGLLQRQHGPALSPDAKELLGHIQAGADRMDRLVSSLLEFSAVPRRPLRRVPTSMRDLALQVVDELRQANPGTQVDIDIAPDLPPCDVDPDLMRQVLQNLIDNALKFARGRAAAHVEVGGTRGARETVYFVRDDGVGFDPCLAQRLFAPFQTLHDRQHHPGLGIGLSIVQRIVLRHGGRVWAESQPGHGATFSFAVPNAGVADATVTISAA